MKSLLTLLLGITFLKFCSTEGEQGGGGNQVTVPCITCGYYGTGENVNYTMKVEDIPSGCENILYGVYSWDKELPAVDMEAIKCLVDNGNSVYTVFAGFDAPPPWVEMMTTDTRNDVIEQMATFMKDNQISGILLEFSGLYKLNQTDLACHTNTLICKIKQCYPTLAVGMILDGMEHTKWPDKQLFDFSVVEADFFLIDTYNINIDCAESLCRRLPLEELQKIADSASSAGMDSKKLRISYDIRVSWVLNNELQPSIDYSTYCCPGEKDPKGNWYCPDSTEIFYEQAQFAKQNAGGFFLTPLNKDDYKSSCGCGLFPVTNAYIDGWNSKKSTCCIPQSSGV